MGRRKGGTNRPVIEFRNDAGGNEPENDGTDDGSFIVDPTAGGSFGDETGESDSGTGATSPRKSKRGRPRGSANSKKKAGALGLNLVIANLLYVIHGGVSKITAIPELALDKEEADALGEAVALVGEQYDVEVSEKTAAWVNLAGVMSTTYGTRIWAYQLRMKMQQGQNMELPPDGAA